MTSATYGEGNIKAVTWIKVTQQIGGPEGLSVYRRIGLSFKYYSVSFPFFSSSVPGWTALHHLMRGVGYRTIFLYTQDLLRCVNVNVTTNFLLLSCCLFFTSSAPAHETSKWRPKSKSPRKWEGVSLPWEGGRLRHTSAARICRQGSVTSRLPTGKMRLYDYMSLTDRQMSVCRRVVADPANRHRENRPKSFMKKKLLDTTSL